MRIPDTDDDGIGGGAEEELNITHEGTEQEQQFDATIGMLEEVLLDSAFVDMQQQFLQKWCGEFEDTEENKLSYTEAFTQWTDMIESYIEKQLKEKVPGFDMETFFKSISEKDEADVTGEVFDMLMSLGEFTEFKALVLAHKGGAALGAGMELVGAGAGGEAGGGSGGGGIVSSGAEGGGGGENEGRTSTAASGGL